MRLLNTYTLRPSFFESDSVPPYAILSHVWKGKEVEFPNINELIFKDPRSVFRDSWTKICRFCEEIKAREGLQWVWVDTCCIDKKNLAELSESINSMFRWYAQAEACYVYLHDIKLDATGSCTIRNSEWFERAWTLQELIAPRRLYFFDVAWRYLGSKEDAPLVTAILQRTGMWREHLDDFRRASVAQRFSWASSRRARRPEDKAYALLGLFGVNLPLIYGEGFHRAFRRLQEQIVRTSDDESLFAWVRAEEPSPFNMHSSGVLASDLQDFEDSYDVVRYRSGRAPYSLTNKGLCIDVNWYEPSESVEEYYDLDEDAKVVPLNCGRHQSNKSLCIILNIYDEQIRKDPPIHVKLDYMGSTSDRPKGTIEFTSTFTICQRLPYALTEMSVWPSNERTRRIIHVLDDATPIQVRPHPPEPRPPKPEKSMCIVQ